MNDFKLVERILSNDSAAIREFFFVRCRDTFAYIGQYFCDGMTAEEIIGEAFEVLSADNWHKLRIFRFSSSLVTYVSVIIARHFQHKRDRNLPSDDDTLIRIGGKSYNSGSESFLMEDVNKALDRFKPLDRVLLQRILLDGEKPRDIIEDLRDMILAEEGEAFVTGHSQEQLSGYVYTRYSRVKNKFQNYMRRGGYDA